MTKKQKQPMKDLETLNVGANVHVIGYDSKSGKTGLVPLSAINGNTPWFGRRWRKGDATTAGTAVGDFEMGQNLAHLLGLGGYLVQNDHSRKKLSASSHRLLENGATADLTGGGGHYQWGWNVPFYYQVYEDDTYMYETISIAGPRPGFWNYRIPVGSRSCAGYATMDRTNGRLVSAVNATAQYRGGNNDATLDSAYNSQLCKPATNMQISAFRTAARKNGRLWFANERVMQYVTAALKRIIFGNRNIQAGFNGNMDSNGLRQGGTGMGADIPGDWNNNFHFYPYIRLDVGVEKGDFTGLISTTITEAGASRGINNIPCFYGLKNDYKYLFCMSENMLLQSNSDKSQSLFVADRIDGSEMNLGSVAGLRQVATGPVANEGSWQYAKEYTLKNLAFFPKPELGGSTSTFWADGYYNPAATSGLRGAGLLGDAGDGDNAGSLSLSGGDGVSGASASWGAFLCEWAEEFTTEPKWCAESE